MSARITYLSASFLLGLLLLSSCCKGRHDGIIKHDCTGSYIEINQLDYKIYNPTIVTNYPDGTHVEVSFETENDPPYSLNPSICQMYHEHNGYVRITEID